MNLLFKRIINLLFLLLPFSLLGQKDSLVAIIIDDYCMMAEKMELKFDQDSLPWDELEYVFKKGIRSVRETNTLTFNELGLLLGKEHPEFSEEELLLETGIIMMEPLIERCDAYANMIKFLLPPCKEFKESPKMIADTVSTMIDNHPPMRLLDEYDVFNTMWKEVIFENEEQVDGEYEDGISNVGFMKDVRVCLCHKNEKYYKAYLLFLSLRPFYKR